MCLVAGKAKGSIQKAAGCSLQMQADWTHTDHLQKATIGSLVSATNSLELRRQRPTSNGV